MESISVLIIEGEPNLRRQLASVLAEAGYTVVDMRDYPEALLKLDEFKPDIAIVDEALPGGDGKDACSRLRNAFGIPVILLGAGSGGEAWMRAVEAGADFYFERPIKYREAVARVKAILRRYKKVAGCSGNQGRSTIPSPFPSRTEP